MEELTLMFLMGLVLGALIGAFIVCSFVASKESEQNDVINKAIELLENSEIDLDDQLIYDLRDYSTYDLDKIINILKGVDK